MESARYSKRHKCLRQFTYPLRIKDFPVNTGHEAEELSFVVCDVNSEKKSASNFFDWGAFLSFEPLKMSRIGFMPKYQNKEKTVIKDRGRGSDFSLIGEMCYGITFSLTKELFMTQVFFCLFCFIFSMNFHGVV